MRWGLEVKWGGGDESGSLLDATCELHSLCFVSFVDRFVVLVFLLDDVLLLLHPH